ncbi:XdhC family protein [Burkholderia sp. 22PA0099]|uniref:XdhC family protein n=1 Tax=Burkholderia sp. 22PA0099 TaxID=3237372 RepID=UPI0039C39A1E
MDNLDLDVLATLAGWLHDGRGALLATVVRTWGSAPRQAGSMLAVRDDGLAVGSVSGGCIDDALIADVQRDGLPAGTPFATTYGLAADDAHRFGLPCGGTLELVLEPLPAGRHAAQFAALAARLRDGELVARTLDLASGAATLAAGHADRGLRFDGRRLVTLHGPRYRLLLIGAGQLGRYVASGAMGLGYEVSVCDPRVEHTGQWDVPGARLVSGMPDDAVIALRPDARTAVIALTHDPKLDDLALLEALTTPAFYVGAIGSRRNNAARRERLALFDLDAAAIARLRGPIGLYIGSRTPPEIAISILAELTACRNGVPIGRQPSDVATGKQAEQEDEAADAIARACGVVTA